jgi:hypothetical protein
MKYRPGLGMHHFKISDMQLFDDYTFIVDLNRGMALFLKYKDEEPRYINPRMRLHKTVGDPKRGEPFEDWYMFGLEGKGLSMKLKGTAGYVDFDVTYNNIKL